MQPSFPLSRVWLATALVSTVWAQPQTVFEAARPRVFPDHAPHGSAVPFSSRWKRPVNANDGHDTFRDAARFHATHLMWCYVRDVAFIREAKARGYIFQATLNTILDGRPAGFTPTQGRVMNRDGNLVTAPWMQGWANTWWGCVNSAEFRAVYLHHAKIAVEGGADLLQQDDPGFNFAAVNWGGCFCPACQQGFAAFRQEHPDATMHEFQQHSVERFYADMWPAIDALAGRSIPKSSNNYRGRYGFPHNLFDFGVAELPDVTLESFVESQRNSLREGRVQVFTAVTRKVATNRQGIAMAYATGASMIVPWDVYMGSGEPRYFGTPEEYADLYGFVRASAEVLDGYEHAGVFSPGGMNDHPYAETPPVTVVGPPTVYASLRAVPGGTDRPVAVHLVDWSEKPAPFGLLFQPGRIFGDRPVRYELWTPAPYDEAAHRQAAETGDYAALVRKEVLATGGVTQIEIDRLDPWGILVLVPLAPDPGLVWQPAVAVGDLGSPRLQIQLASQTPGRIQYSLAGSADTRPYEGGIEVAETDVLIARTIAADGRVSVPVRLRLVNARAGLAVWEPDHAELAGHLKLWLRAGDVAPEHRQEVQTWSAAAGPGLHFAARPVYDGRLSTPPQVVPGAIGGQPVVRFGRETDLLSLPGFANQALAGNAFTVFVVSQSKNPGFGLSGNDPDGRGGVPRLYLMRNSFVYDEYSPPAMIQGIEDGPEVLVYTHDGNETIRAFRGRDMQSAVTGKKVVPAFGAGGSLAMPFWVGNQPQTGDLAEIVVFDRELTEAERLAVVAYLDGKYRLGVFPTWVLESVGEPE